MPENPHNPHRPAHLPECPRCGYDQSGELATWRESCPLSGICPECGLTLEWREVVSPERRPPRWSYEHGPRGLAGIAGPHALLRFVRTLAGCLTAWRLWRELRMHHPIALLRLAIVSILGAAVVAGLTLLLIGVLDGVRSPRYNGLDTFFDNVVEPFTEPLDALPSMAGHVGSVRMRIVDRWMLVSGWVLVVAPVALVGLRQTVRGARVRVAHMVRIVAYGFVPVPLVLAGWGLSRDVVRTAAAVWPSWIPGSGWITGRLWAMSEWLMEHRHWPWVAVVVCVYTVGWLWIAYWRYLKLPHAFGVAVASVAVALLTGVALVALLPGGLNGLV